MVFVYWFLVGILLLACVDVVYLDHAGATLYSESQMEDIFKDLNSTLYGNPRILNTLSCLFQKHWWFVVGTWISDIWMYFLIENYIDSQSNCSLTTSDIVGDARRQVRRYLEPTSCLPNNWPLLTLFFRQHDWYQGLHSNLFVNRVEHMRSISSWNSIDGSYSYLKGGFWFWCRSLVSLMHLLESINVYLPQGQQLHWNLSARHFLGAIRVLLCTQWRTTTVSLGSESILFIEWFLIMVIRNTEEPEF